MISETSSVQKFSRRGRDGKIGTIFDRREILFIYILFGLVLIPLDIPLHGRFCLILCKW